MPEYDQEIKRLTPAEFRELGYLQELNRRLLHPLGLALEVVLDATTNAVTFGGVWDYRGDPQGLVFGDGLLDAAKARRVEEEWLRRHKPRFDALGFFVQPVE